MAVQIALQNLYCSQLIDLLLPAVLAIVPITALVMAVTGMVAQKCAGGKEHKNG